ncbi:P-loop containing nucleoside triphosphate hydrolase protein [Polychaeton citri CBS 116435]|uniref:P-loop containing nucleoside triphosphate hydrolase protein n=1 Tax=Polychaeton citri CBS 116435 TaxID=1314669 RepID=A0A9P4QFR5_9PEZI|nr:P-loop containing nucleoside triphosphate hydrolase protein [Polychaeton citri CBS 116435]
MVLCPICERPVKEVNINTHIDSGCTEHIDEPSPPASQVEGQKLPTKTASFFLTPASKRTSKPKDDGEPAANPSPPPVALATPAASAEVISSTTPSNPRWIKREYEHDELDSIPQATPHKKAKAAAAAHVPLAERMRPQTLDEVAGQNLVGPDGVLRNLVVTDRVPSMILWGGPGTGKTTIARLMARASGSRFVEINSTTSGVAECKRLFQEARNELGLTGRKTIIFLDEIHRHSKSQQDVFLAPVESGQITLVGATTENPSFKVTSALLSRCRTFTLSKLGEQDIFGILKRALYTERAEAGSSDATQSCYHLLTDDDMALLHYLAAFADGDARTGLNLLELAMDLCQKPSTSAEDIKKSLTQTLVYDRAGDQHYDTISAFHKSVRGSNADAALYYLARMLQSGEDPLYVARRMVVIASEDVGLADNSMLGLATATYSACEKIGMPECRINLGHCAVALCLAPKSTRAYRALSAAYAALSEPGIAGIPVPVHLRNAQTRLMKELGYGKEYKYNPDYVDGQVVQHYLPERLLGRRFLGLHDFGDKVDPDIETEKDLDNTVDMEDQDEVLLNPDGD